MFQQYNYAFCVILIGVQLLVPHTNIQIFLNKNIEEMGNHMSEETKPHIVKSHDINLDSDYVNWIHDVK